jgi:hypothetical protein
MAAVGVVGVSLVQFGFDPSSDSPPEFLAYDLPQRFHAVKRLAKARNQSSEPTVAVMKSSFRLSVSQISLSIAWRVSLPPKIAQPNFNCQKFPSSPSQLLILNNH